MRRTLDREDRLRRARFNFNRYPPTGNTRAHRVAYLLEVGLDPRQQKTERAGPDRRRG